MNRTICKKSRPVCGVSKADLCGNSWPWMRKIHKTQGRIQDFVRGGHKWLAVCNSAQSALLGGSGGMPPQENFPFQAFWDHSGAVSGQNGRSVVCARTPQSQCEVVRSWLLLLHEAMPHSKHWIRENKGSMQGRSQTFIKGVSITYGACAEHLPRPWVCAWR